MHSFSIVVDADLNLFAYFFILRQEPRWGLRQDSLAAGSYITNGESVLITGATGCGKSFISSALGHHACAQGYKVAYFNVQKLLQQKKIARIEGTIHQLLQRIS